MRDDSGTMAALGALGLACATTPAAARADINRGGFAYVPLEALSPRLLELLKLREVLGLRSCINTVLRAFNPVGANASMVGVFHPPYLGLQVDAARLLGQRRMAAFKGGGGEAERNPFKELAVNDLKAGDATKTQWPALIEGEHRRLNEFLQVDVTQLTGLWRGEVVDPVGEAIVMGTAAVALAAVGRVSSPAEADALAKEIWSQRDRRLLPLTRKAA